MAAAVAAIMDIRIELFNNSEFPCCPDVSHKVSAQSD